MLIIIIFIMILIGCDNDTKSDIQELKIGAILPLSGDNGSYGVDCRKGMSVAIEQYNSNHDQKVKIIYEDSKAEPKVAVSAINKLIGLEKIPYVLGGMFSSTTIAIASVAQENKVIVISPTAASKEVTKKGDYIFSIYPTSKMEGEFIVKYLLKKKIKNIGVLTQKVQAAEEISEALIKSFKKSGGFVKYNLIIENNVKNYRNYLLNIKNEAVDAIFLSGYKDMVVNLIKQAKEMGLNTLFISQSTMYDQSILKDYSEIVNGLVFSAPFYNEYQKTTEIERFKSLFRQKYNKLPNIWSAYGYDVVNILLNSIEQSKKNKSSVLNELKNIKFEGVTGKMTFDNNRTALKAMQMFIVKDKKFALVK